MIHPTAIVDEGAELGVDVDIGPYTVVEQDVQIGDRCVIGPRVSLLRYTTLGAGCRVHAGALIGDTPQDTAFENVRSFVRVGQDCQIRECATIHRGTKEDSTTEIGDGCFIMGLTHLAHNVRLGRQVVMVNGGLVGGYAEIGDRAFLSGNVTVHQFVKIGTLAMLGGNCGVTKDVPPFCTVRPVSMNVVAGLNVVGMRRAGLTAADRMQVKRAFGILYRSGLNVRQAEERLRQDCPDGPASEFWRFIEESRRGICAAAVPSPGED